MPGLLNWVLDGFSHSGLWDEKLKQSPPNLREPKGIVAEEEVLRFSFFALFEFALVEK